MAILLSAPIKLMIPSLGQLASKSGKVGSGEQLYDEINKLILSSNVRVIQLALIRADT